MEKNVKIEKALDTLFVFQQKKQKKVKSSTSTSKNIKQEFIKSLEIIDLEGKVREIKVNLIREKLGEDLEKSLASSWMGEELKIEKTGKEIKVKLSELKQEEEIQLGVIIKTLQELKEIIPLIPKKSLSKWDINSFQLKELSNTIKLYDIWGTSASPGEEKTVEFSQIKELDRTTQSIQVSDEIRENMRAYNSLIYDYLDILKEMSFIDIYFKNLKDKEIYKLSGQQAYELSF